MIPFSVVESGDGYDIGVYAALAKFANRQGESWPSVETICTTTGWGKTRVRKSLRQLEKKGFLTVIKQVGRSNTYVLTQHPTRDDTAPPHDLRVISSQPGGGPENTLPSYHETNPNYNQELEPENYIEPPDRFEPYDLWVWWLAKTGQAPDTKVDGRSMRGAKNLIEAGVTIPQADQLFDWLNGQQFWQRVGVSLWVMYSRLPEWRAATSVPDQPEDDWEATRRRFAGG